MGDPTQKRERERREKKTKIHHVSQPV